MCVEPYISLVSIFCISQELGYTAPYIAQLSGLHLRRVRRLMTANDLCCRNYSEISDVDLDNLVKEILELDKCLGNFNILTEIVLY